MRCSHWQVLAGPYRWPSQVGSMPGEFWQYRPRSRPCAFLVPHPLSGLLLSQRMPHCERHVRILVRTFPIDRSRQNRVEVDRSPVALRPRYARRISFAHRLPRQRTMGISPNSGDRSWSCQQGHSRIPKRSHREKHFDSLANHSRNCGDFDHPANCNAACSSTFPPAAMSSGSECSISAWLTPPWLRTKIIPDGTRSARCLASCPAPDHSSS